MIEPNASVAGWSERVESISKSKGADSAALVRPLLQHGLALIESGDAARAWRSLERAQMLYDQHLLADARLLADSFLFQGLCRVRLGDDEAAMKCWRECEALLEEVYGSDCLLGLPVKLNLANLLIRLGRASEAVPLLEAARRTAESSFGLHQGLVADVLHTLALALESQGDDGAAVELYERSLAARKRSPVGDDEPTLLATMSNLAGLRKVRGEYTAAFALYRDVRAAWLARAGPGHADTLEAAFQMAIVLCYVNRFDQAATLLSEVLAGRTALYGSADHPLVVEVAAILGPVQAAQSRQVRRQAA